MRKLKSIAVVAVLFLATSVFSSDSWTFDPDMYKANIKDDHIYFEAKDNNQEETPELYADDTNVQFFNLVQNLIRKAKRSKTPVDFNFESYESTDNGTYNKIIPQN